MLPIFFLVALDLMRGPAGSPEQKQPQLASRNQSVALVYGAGSAIYFSGSEDGGATFTHATKVADNPGLALGRHRGPRVAILEHGIVVSAIPAATPGATAALGGAAHIGDIVVWRSADQGKTWVPGSAVNDVPGSAREGLHAMASDGKGTLFMAWLDLRAKGTRLYGSRSTDEGKTWSKNVLIYQSPDGTICQCCDPSVAFDEKGEVWTMWRNALGGNRDFYLSHSADGVKFSAAEKIGKGSWELNACPMDGGGLVAADGRAVSAWRRGNEIFEVSGSEAERRLGTGKDVAIAGTAQAAFVVWVGTKGIEAKIPGSAGLTQLSSAGAYPALAALADGSVLAAWEEKGGIRIERLTTAGARAGLK